MIKFVQSVLLFGSILVTAFGHAATTFAATQPDKAKTETIDRTALRDTLFKELRNARSEREARYIADRIWAFWKQGPDEKATQQIANIFVARRLGELDEALKTANELTQRVPDYAEGWNQKATLHFLKGELDASLEAVERVLALEPKHFGALAGKAIILMHQGRVGVAQLVLRRAVDIHPFLNERRLLREPPGLPI